MTTKTTTKKTPTPPPVELTVEERKANALEFVIRRLNRTADNGREAQAELAAAVAKDAPNAIQWGENRIIDVELGRLAARVFAIADNLTKPGPDGEAGRTLYAAMVRACEVVGDDLTGDLLNNRLRASSTSAFSNAVEAARREAYARMIEQCASASTWLGQEGGAA